MQKADERAERGAIAVEVPRNVSDCIAICFVVLFEKRVHFGRAKVTRDARGSDEAQVGTDSAPIAYAEVTPSEVNAGGPESLLHKVKCKKI